MEVERVCCVSVTRQANSVSFSFKEALCSAVPTVFMPLFGDQVLHAYNGVRQGWAAYLNKRRLGDTEHVVRVVLDALADAQRLRLNARRARAIWTDLPIDSMDAASFRFRKLLEQKGGQMPEKHFYRRVESSSECLCPILVFILGMVCAIS